MISVKVSPKFQVLIPREIRESMSISPGQKMQVVQYKNRIEFIPEKDISELKGFLKGMNTAFKREDDRL